MIRVIGMKNDIEKDLEIIGGVPLETEEEKEEEPKAKKSQKKS